MASQCDDLLETVRARLGAEVRRFLTGQTRPPAHRMSRDGSDPGLFGPDSVTWRVHADMSTIVGGLRALLLQTLHPLAIAAVADHSDYRHDPLGRLHRTAGFVSATTFGTTAVAEQAIASVRRVHDRVVGVAPDGRPYTANDPHLLTWVHVTEVESFLLAYQRYGAGRLDDAEADRYVAEMATVGRRLGAEDVPESVAEMKAWLEEVRPELAGGRRPRETALFILMPPWPLAARPPYALVAAAAVGLLPGWARRMLWLPTVPLADAVVVRPACVATLRILGWALTPPRTAEGSDGREPAGGDMDTAA